MNVTLDQLQQLAEQLDPLETALAEVRFLNVDFEQLEKNCEEALGQMHDELEQEKALEADIELTAGETAELAKQLPTMGEDLKALQRVQDTVIPAMAKRLEVLKQQGQPEKEAAPRHVVRPTEPAAAERIAELEGRVDALKETLNVRVKVAAMAPELETLISVSQRAVEEAEAADAAAEADGGGKKTKKKGSKKAAASMSIEDQGEALRALEAHKQKLDNLMAQLPAQAEEAKPLLERGAQQLDLISNQIRRLGEALGHKMAMAAQFVAARTEAHNQLEELEHNLAQHEHRSVTSTATTQSDEPSVVALAEQEQRVKQLHTKLSAELASVELEPEQKQQLEELNNALARTLTRVQVAQQQLEVGGFEAGGRAGGQASNQPSPFVITYCWGSCMVVHIRWWTEKSSWHSIYSIGGAVNQTPTHPFITYLPYLPTVPIYHSLTLPPHRNGSRPMDAMHSSVGRPHASTTHWWRWPSRHTRC